MANGRSAKLAVKIRDDFLSIASHELRTPLTALNLQLYLLEKTAKGVTHDGDICVESISGKGAKFAAKILL